MENTDYDILKAEQVLRQAQAITGPGRTNAAARIGMFGEVTTTLGHSIAEVKRVRVAHAAALSEAMNQMRTIIRKEVDTAIARHSTLQDAVTTFKESVKLQRHVASKKWIWKSNVTEAEFHAACDKLFVALYKSMQP